MKLLLAFLRASRPKQWVKNGLLFVAIIFSAKYGEADLWIRVWVGFGAFCCLASAGYLMNDIMDRDADRKHPRKSKRPIASGALPVSVASLGVVAYLLLGLAAAYWVSPIFFGVSMGYLLTTLTYSFVLKHVMIVDVLVLSLCYVWRAVAGALAIDVLVSPWLFLCTAFLALFIGFNKRRAELLQLGDGAGTRKILRQYSPALLQQYQSAVTSAAIVSYALYTVQGARTAWLVLTLPFVMYGLFRFAYLVEHRGKGEAPDETLLTDPPLVMSGVMYLVVAVTVIQLHVSGFFDAWLVTMPLE